MVELREITKENYEDVINLRVSSNQANYVSTPVHSLAQAWVFKNNAFPFAIYADDVLVGFVMLGYYEIKNQYTLWKFMIDENYQNKGYGKKALALAIRYLIDKFNILEVFAGVHNENIVAKNLYQSIGFKLTGEAEDYQLEMKLLISNFLL